MPYDLNIELEGIASLLMHKPTQNKKEAIETEQITKILKRDPFDEDAIKRSVEMCLYRNKENKICIPSIWLERTLVKAGTSFKLGGSGKKTYKDHLNAFVTAHPELSPLSNQKFEIDTRSVIINRGRILRSRPKFEEGWKVNFQVVIQNDEITINTFKEILEFAGKYGGLGDYRPKYGRFKVNNIEKVK